jgi:hypothetical protein
MPRVIQPGGGGGKMRVRYTARRKHGLVAAYKRMQAEGMSLHATTSDCVLTPFIKRSRTPTPGRFSPNPVVLRLIVMLSGLRPGGLFDLDRPVEK